MKRRTHVSTEKSGAVRSPFGIAERAVEQRLALPVDEVLVFDELHDPEAVQALQDVLPLAWLRTHLGLPEPRWPMLR